MSKKTAEQHTPDELREMEPQESSDSVKIAGTVRANQNRPAENGTGGSQPVKLGSDPSKWTKEQFRDVYKRVGRGERIVL